MEIQTGQQNYKVYIKINLSNQITAIEGGWYQPTDLTDLLEIDRGTQDPKYTHPCGNYLPKTLMDMQGCHNYKYIGGKVIECTASDKAAELARKPPTPPTEAERLASAESAILALMGGTAHV